MHPEILPESFHHQGQNPPRKQQCTLFLGRTKVSPSVSNISPASRPASTLYLPPENRQIRTLHITMAQESTPTAVIAASVASSALIAYLLLSKKPMSTKEKAIAAAGEAKLPPRFVVGSFTNKRSQSIYTLHLPRKDESKPAKSMLLLVHGIAEHCKCVIRAFCNDTCALKSKLIPLYLTMTVPKQLIDHRQPSWIYSTL